MKRSRLSRNAKGMKKKRLNPVDSVAAGMAAGGVLGILGKVKDIGKDIPKAAKEVTESGFLHELIHLEKKPESLSPDEAHHARELLESGASWEDISKEFGYRPDTMKQLVEETEVDAGEARGFF